MKSARPHLLTGLQWPANQAKMLQWWRTNAMRREIWWASLCRGGSLGEGNNVYEVKGTVPQCKLQNLDVIGSNRVE